MGNLLDSIKNFFGSFLQGKGGASVLGIDIGSSSIKVVQLRKRRGAAVLETYGELSLGPYSNLDVGRATSLQEAKLSEALADVLREANVTTKLCGVAIPFSASLISVMEMPMVDQKQLAQMIPIEARKYIPVPISEVTLDWFIIPEDRSKYLSQDGSSEQGGAKKTQVLLVAIHNEVLNKYREVLQKANLNVSFYEIEIFSTIRATIGQGIDPVMIIDIGSASTKVYIVELGVVKISHIINRGSQDITLALSRSTGVSVNKAEEIKRTVGLNESVEYASAKDSILLTLEYIFSESNRVLLNYQRKYNRNISKVVFTGGGAVLAGLEKISGERFNVPVEVANPFAKTEAPAFLENVLKEVGPEFAVSVGAALRKLQELD